MIDGLFLDVGESMRGHQQSTMSGDWVNCWPTVADIRKATADRQRVRFAAERARIWGA